MCSQNSARLAPPRSYQAARYTRSAPNGSNPERRSKELARRPALLLSWGQGQRTVDAAKRAHLGARLSRLARKSFQIRNGNCNHRERHKRNQESPSCRATTYYQSKDQHAGAAEGNGSTLQQRYRERHVGFTPTDGIVSRESPFYWIAKEDHVREYRGGDHHQRQQFDHVRDIVLRRLCGLSRVTAGT